ncbi:phosphoribosylformylglycinamidine synthase-like [Malurus melanocephalus]|uniref:phosphoribosylformylglycinamidine synthase-like n=1 Tax=Malurus melanocephalus TaxID=175006 RepID=UPI002548AC30|nr:phosphoribosylformylglycinamidine synthase-like [Malurus melanocephalus]
MALLGWVGPPKEEGSLSPQGSVALRPNLSGRFESRFVTVRVTPGPSVMLRGMDGAALGVWVAHGEGWFQFHPCLVLDHCLCSGLVTLTVYSQSATGSDWFRLVLLVFLWVFTFFTGLAVFSLFFFLFLTGFYQSVIGFVTTF